MRVGIDSLLSSIWVFSTDLKRIQTPHSSFWECRADKTFTAHWLKFKSKFKPLQVIWQSLPKGILDDNSRFWLQNQWQRSWGSTPAVSRVQHSLGWSDRLAQFQVCCSSCWQLPACLRKTCYHSFDTDSVWATLLTLTQFESKKVLMLCKFQAVTSQLFFMPSEIFGWNSWSCC